MDRPLTATELSLAFQQLRERLGKDKHAFLVTFNGTGHNGMGEKPVYQFISTLERTDAIRMLRDLANAMEERPPAPNLDLN